MRTNPNPTEPIGQTPISVVTLAFELGEPVDQLAARLRAEVFVEPSSGLRCVSVEVCRRVIDEAHARAARLAKMMAENEAKLLAMRPPPRRYARDEHLEALAARDFTSGVAR